MIRFVTGLMYSPRLPAAVAIAVCLTANSSLSSTIIYQDDFSGLVTDDLGGTTPDISLTGGDWVTANSRGGPDDVDAALVFAADGTIFKDGDNPSHDAGALLPLSLAGEAIYTLEATFFNTNSNWVAMGFASNDLFLDSVNGRHSNNGPAVFGGYAWGLLRDNSNSSNNDQAFFNGIGTGNSAVGGRFVDPLSPITMKIVLDTSDTTGITAEYFLDGVQYGGTQTLPAAAFTDISFVGISSDGALGLVPASVSDFSLTSELIPEPTSLFSSLSVAAIVLVSRTRSRQTLRSVRILV